MDVKSKIKQTKFMNRKRKVLEILEHLLLSELRPDELIIDKLYWSFDCVYSAEEFKFSRLGPAAMILVLITHALPHFGGKNFLLLHVQLVDIVY